MTKIAHGFRFLPTDDELILKFLLKKVKGEPLSSEDVTDCEIYGDNDKEPWKIFGETSSKKFYVFTKLKKKGRGRRIERKAGCGTWKGQRTEEIKDSQNYHVGFKKAFVFEVKDSGSNDLNKGHWLMHEFSLLNDEIDYVLCEIRNKHPIDIVDDQQQQKRVRFSNSLEEEEQNSFLGAAGPMSPLLASDGASMNFVAGSNSFIEAATTASTFASNEALDYSAIPTEEEQNSFLGAAGPMSPLLASDGASMDFVAGSNSFIEAATTASTFALNQALDFSAIPIEEEQNSFLGAAAPMSTLLASDEASMDFLTGSGSFIEAATTASTFALNEAMDYSAIPTAEEQNSFLGAAAPMSTLLASDEASMDFLTGSSSFIEAPTTASTFALNEAMDYSAIPTEEEQNSFLGAVGPMSPLLASDGASMDFVAGSNSFIEAATTASTFSLNEALDYSAIPTSVSASNSGAPQIQPQHWALMQQP